VGALALSEFVDDAGDGRDWSVSRQVTVVAIMALMIVALGAVALKGGSSRADTSAPLAPGAAAGAGAAGPGVAVPSVVGMTQAEATKVLATVGFKTTISVSRADDKVPVGKIANQLPAAGKKAVKGSVVQLALSLGATQTSVPRLVGYPAEGALTLLQRAGLGYTASTEVSDQAVGTVLRQSPAPGAQRPKGTKVAIIVSSGTSWLLPGETVPETVPPAPADTGVVYWVPPATRAQPASPVAAGGGTTVRPNHGTSMGGGGSGSHPPTTRPPTTRPPTTRPPVTLRPYPTSPPTTCIDRPLPDGQMTHFCW